MDVILRRLIRSAFRRGMAGDHWAWLVLAAGAFIIRRARSSKDDPIRLTLRAGESYLVRLSDPGTPTSVVAEGIDAAS